MLFILWLVTRVLALLVPKTSSMTQVMAAKLGRWSCRLAYSKDPPTHPKARRGAGPPHRLDPAGDRAAGGRQGQADPGDPGRVALALEVELVIGFEDARRHQHTQARS